MSELIFRCNYCKELRPFKRVGKLFKPYQDYYIRKIHGGFSVVECLICGWKWWCEG